MELLQIDTGMQAWAGMLGFAGFILCIVLVITAFTWETSEATEKLKKYTFMVVVICMAISMFAISESAKPLRVYTYKITDPYKVEELLDNGYKLDSINGVIYKFTIKEQNK